METKKLSFTAAMRDFFGQKPGQTLMQFAAEVKALTKDDREYFKKGLATVGYEVTEIPSA